MSVYAQVMENAAECRDRDIRATIGTLSHLANRAAKEGKKDLCYSCNAEIHGLTRILVEREQKGTSRKGSEALPDTVRRAIQAAINAIAEFNAEIVRLKALEAKIGGKGRYQADAWLRHGWENACESAYATIERFRTFAPRHGIDFDLVLEDLGFEERCEPSADALEWR